MQYFEVPKEHLNEDHSLILSPLRHYFTKCNSNNLTYFEGNSNLKRVRIVHIHCTLAVVNVFWLVVDHNFFDGPILATEFLSSEVLLICYALWDAYYIEELVLDYSETE